MFCSVLPCVVFGLHCSFSIACCTSLVSFLFVHSWFVCATVLMLCSCVAVPSSIWTLALCPGASRYQCSVSALPWFAPLRPCVVLALPRNPLALRLLCVALRILGFLKKRRPLLGPGSIENQRGYHFQSSELASGSCKSRCEPVSSRFPIA